MMPQASHCDRRRSQTLGQKVVHELECPVEETSQWAPIPTVLYTPMRTCMGPS